jgi:hypothetical protein
MRAGPISRPLFMFAYSKSILLYAKEFYEPLSRGLEGCLFLILRSSTEGLRQ